MPASRTRADVDDSLVAVPERAASRLAGVTPRQLRYWHEIGLLRPAIERRLSPRNSVRLYDFADLVELLVIAQLLDLFSLQHVRGVVEHLRARGYDRPLTQLRFAVEGKEIFFQHPDGAWEGDRRPRQSVILHVLDVREIQARLRSELREGRRPELEGSIERRRKVVGSKPVFAGTRTPVEAVFPYLRRGMADEKILAAFPHLAPADVAAARRELSQTDVA